MRQHPILRLFILIILFSFVNSVNAGYEFLGNVREAEPTETGVDLICDGDHVLEVNFTTPEIVRVTLYLNGIDEQPLTDALALREQVPVPVVFSETADSYAIRSDAVAVSIGKSPCRLTFSDADGHMLSQDDPGMGIGWEGDEVRCWKTITADEKFFGLGEKTGGLNKRGREWVMWNSDIPAYNDQTDPIYQSIPFFLGIREARAYGIFFNNSYRSRFNMGAGNLRYYSFSAQGGLLDYFFISGPQVRDVVTRFADLTGKPPLPPKWALGYQQCRWSYYPESEVMDLAKTFREKMIPADVIYLDIHYMDDYRVFSWDKDRFPDPQGMLKRLDKMGFKIVTIIDPGVKADSLYPVTREGLAGDHFVCYPDGEVYIGEVWPGPSYFPDFSRPETQKWWGDLVGDWLKQGVSGCWNDMNEPVVWGQAFPLETLFDDNGTLSSHKKMHNLYALLMAKATYEGALRSLPDRRPFILTRAGFAGEQRYTAVWTGDNVASEEHLAMSIRMVQGLNLSGVTFSGSDVGGFFDTPSPELFARWIEAGSLTPFFRTHTINGTPDQEPWSFGEYVEDISRKFISLRYRLIPYLYSLFHDATVTGVPIWRPLFWNDQRDDQTYDWAFQHQFFVGDKLLAAPVTQEEQYLQKVYLPEGRWVDWHTDSLYRGPATIIVDAPLDRLPMFLREGAIIPLRDVTQFVDETPIKLLTIDVFPSVKPNTFQFYEDDGKSFAYQNGEYRLAEWNCEMTPSGEILFIQSLLHDGYAWQERDIVFQFHGISAPPKEVHWRYEELSETAPEADGCGYHYDTNRRLLTVRVEDRRADWDLLIR